MDFMTKLYLRGAERKARVRARLAFGRGQTMTEYAMIVAAIAVVLLVGYLTMGNNTNQALTTVDNQL